MPSDEIVWYALSDSTRRRILDLLRNGPRTTGDLCGRFPQTRTAVMKHLDYLEDAGLIRIRRSGRERWNYINATPLRRIYERWLTPFQQLWASSLSRLATSAEGGLNLPDRQSISKAEIVQEIEIEAAPERVFAALTQNVASWWSHVSYDAPGKPNLRIEAHVGGRFFEQAGANERLYAVVTRYEPGALLSMQGPMGMSGCVFGTIDFALEPKGKIATTVKLRHAVIGDVDPETLTMYREGWGGLLDGLKGYVQDGREAWSAA